MNESNPIAIWARVGAGLVVVAMLFAGHHCDPMATKLFLVLFALITVYTGLDIYFMPVGKKREVIAKTKARHGIPADQPHKIDDILRSGYFHI